MSYISPYQKLLIASHNAGKITEIAALLSEFDDAIVSTKDFNIPEPEETADDFAGNAQLKAEFCMNFTNLPALADDSGLCIDALDGAPGIYSARFAKEYGGFDGVMAHLAAQLKGTPNPTAYFTCALALAIPNQEIKIFQGFVYGTLCFPPRGENGFGYDPIFMANDHTLSFGEMPAGKKHAISHRADAFQKLKIFLKNEIF